MQNTMSAVLRLNPIGLGSPRRPPPALTLSWLVFVVSITAFVAEFLLAGRLPAVASLLTVLALVPCGAAWLFARALFRRNTEAERWPLVLVVVLFVVSLVRFASGGTAASGGFMGYLGNVQGMLGSAMLLLTLVEAFDTRGLEATERRFRVSFAAGYVTIMATSIVVRLPEFAYWQEAAQAVLATFALTLGTAAYHYRQRHPLSVPGKVAVPVRPAAQPQLAARITELLDSEQVYLDPDCKVADLAARVEEPEYRVSQCITNDLGARNFNQLINRYRIEAAIALLAREDQRRQSVLSIAMASGFGSLGPFNRAFKASTGMTPTAFRRQALRDVSAD